MNTQSRSLISQNHLTALQEQVLRTIPGAKDAPLEVILGACILAHTLNLSIAAGEIYIGSFGSTKDETTGQWVKSYTYGVGIKGARVLADREARWQVTFRTLSPEEAKALRGKDYDPGDIGVEATLVRFDDAMLAKQAGIPYQPRKAVGWYRVKARYNQKENKWVSDQVPNTWTPYDVAEKRAELSVLKKAFSWGRNVNVRVVDPALFDNSSVDGEYIDKAISQVADQLLAESRKMLSAPHDGEIDENGYIILTREEYARSHALSDEAVVRIAADTDKEDVQNLNLDWSHRYWDHIVVQAIENEWTPPTEERFSRFSAFLRGKQGGNSVSPAIWKELKYRLDHLVGQGGAVPLIAALCGWGQKEQVTNDAAQYLIEIAIGRHKRAQNLLISFAKSLHEQMKNHLAKTENL
jgi:hypothetical protein